MPASCALTAGLCRFDGLDASPALESPPESLVRSRDGDRVVSKSDTKDASRSSGLQQNRGIMRFRFARFTPAKLVVSDLDIGPAAGAVSGTARRRFPMHTLTKPVSGGLFTGLADTGICAGHSAFDGCCE